MLPLPALRATTSSAEARDWSRGITSVQWWWWPNQTAEEEQQQWKRKWRRKDDGETIEELVAFSRFQQQQWKGEEKSAAERAPEEATEEGEGPG